MKKNLLGLSLIPLTVSCFAQQDKINMSINLGIDYQYSNFDLGESQNFKNSKTGFNANFKKSSFDGDVVFASSMPTYKVFNHDYRVNETPSFGELEIHKNNVNGNIFSSKKMTKVGTTGFSSELTQEKLNRNIYTISDEYFDKNRRNIYSGLWAFASLNYLYADLVGLMDAKILSQYQAGVVDGTKITPQFLTLAAGFMQIPLANVFLPQVIKNERTLRWVQIASGTIMTLVQSGTLLVGKPTPYYALFSALEISATTYITIDAIKWKTNSKKRAIPENN